MPVCFENPKWCNAAALGTPPEPGRTCDTDSSSCLNRADTGQNQFPIFVLNTEPSFTSTSSHDFHTPNSDGVLRRDLEPAIHLRCTFDHHVNVVRGGTRDSAHACCKRPIEKGVLDAVDPAELVGEQRHRASRDGGTSGLASFALITRVRPTNCSVRMPALIKRPASRCAVAYAKLALLARSVRLRPSLRIMVESGRAWPSDRKIGAKSAA